MKVLLNGEPRRARRRRDRRRAAVDALDVPPPAAASPWRSTPRSCRAAQWDDARARRRRAGRGPARDPGRLSDRDRHATRSRSPARALRSRLLLGTGGFASLDDARRRRSRPRGTELVTVALRRVDAGRARLDRRRARRRRRRACCPTPPAASRRATRCSPPARPRGVRDRLGQARGDRRRAHAAARRARAARGRRGARRRRLHRAALHERRPDPRAPAGGRRLRGGDAARLADRLAAWASATRTTSR